MALTATIYKAQLQIADMDRGYYADHALTIARHPSETEERMMVRLAAFALHADERLEFTKGLCADDEPELWRKGPGGDIELWVELGLPDERRIRKACSRADQVVVYAYGGRQAALWWERTAAAVRRFEHLGVYALAPEATAALAARARRSMQWQCTIQDGQMWMNDGEETVSVAPQRWYPE